MTDTTRFHPGEYLRDELTERGWSIDTLCEMSGLRRNVVEELMAEKRNVTRLTAWRLAQAFGHRRQTWLNLQRSYNEAEKGD